MTGKKTYMKKDEVPVFLKKVSYTLVFFDGGGSCFEFCVTPRRP